MANRQIEVLKGRMWGEVTAIKTYDIGNAYFGEWLSVVF